MFYGDESPRKIFDVKFTNIIKKKLCLNFERIKKTYGLNKSLNYGQWRNFIKHPKNSIITSSKRYDLISIENRYECKDLGLVRLKVKETKIIISFK